MSQSEIAEKFDVDSTTIQKWMKRNEVETRSKVEAKLIENPHPSYFTNNEGYEVFQSTYKGRIDRVRHNKLLAVAKYGYEMTVNSDHVHHINGVTWADWKDNISLISREDHAREHHQDINFQKKLLINELDNGERLTQREIAESLSISRSTVSYHVEDATVVPS